MKSAAILIALVAGMLAGTLLLSRVDARADAHALQILTLESGVFACDGQNHFTESVQPMRIRKIYVWYGMDMGGRADFLGVLIKQRGDEWHQEYIAKGGIDHYTDPTGIDAQTLQLDFAPDWIRIGAGESVRLYYQCNGFSQPTPNAKVIAVIYYLP